VRSVVWVDGMLAGTTMEASITSSWVAIWREGERAARRHGMMVDAAASWSGVAPPWTVMSGTEARSSAVPPPAHELLQNGRRG